MLFSVCMCAHTQEEKPLPTAAAGDHDVLICRVVRWENLEAQPRRVLYTESLRAAGLIP